MAETVKHTPGPWKVRPHCSYEYRFEVYPDRAVEFADVSGHSSSDIDVEIAEAYANANLIAAAPDLLEVAHKVVNNWGNLHHKDLMQLRAAIAKAEGRS